MNQTNDYPGKNAKSNSYREQQLPSRSLERRYRTGSVTMDPYDGIDGDGARPAYCCQLKPANTPRDGWLNPYAVW